LGLAERSARGEETGGRADGEFDEVLVGLDEFLDNSERRSVGVFRRGTLWCWRVRKWGIGESFAGLKGEGQREEEAEDKGSSRVESLHELPGVALEGPRVNVVWAEIS
jgi:hypothetical protein